jgi:hypothetical protein
MIYFEVCLRRECEEARVVFIMVKLNGKMFLGEGVVMFFVLSLPVTGGIKSTRLSFCSVFSTKFNSLFFKRIIIITSSTKQNKKRHPPPHIVKTQNLLCEYYGIDSLKYNFHLRIKCDLVLFIVKL